jgi:hypothetical protein
MREGLSQLQTYVATFGSQIENHLSFDTEDFHKEPYYQGFRRVACHPKTASHSGRQYSRRKEGIPTSSRDITYPIIGHPKRH